MIVTAENQAQLLASLYNEARPQGMGFMHYDPRPMTEEQAADMLSSAGPRVYVDYLKGRVMKVNLSVGQEVDLRLFVRDNGQAAADAALAGIDV